MRVEKPIPLSTGREWDKETGLYYYRARYYDPMEGRFISKDPISFAGGDVNLYAYVENNPINWIDPSGLSKTKGILNGNDEYLRRLKDANGDRNKINEIKRGRAEGQVWTLTRRRFVQVQTWGIRIETPVVTIYTFLLPDAKIC